MRHNALTSKQLIFVVVGIMGVKIISLPELLVTDAQQDAWIAVILGAIFPIITLFLIDGAARRVPAANFVEMNKLLFGKLIGSILVVAYIGYLFYINTVLLRFATVISQIFLLPKTPASVISFIFLLFTLYLGGKGATVVGRFNELLFYVVLIMVPMVIIVTWYGGDYTNLLPIGASGIQAIGKASLKMVWTYSGMESLVVLYWLVTRKNEVTKAGLTAVAISCALYLLVMVSTIMVFDSFWLDKTFGPVIILFKTEQLPIIDRLDFFFLVIWLDIAIRPIVTMFLLSSLSLNQLLAPLSDRYLRWVPIISAVILFSMAQMIPDTLALNQWVKYGILAAYAAQLGYPLLLWIAAWIQKKRVQALA